MSENSVFIPGISDKYNSNQAINKIMESKRVKLEKMEGEEEVLKEKKIAWNEIKQKALSLQTYSKKLYGFDAPFDDKISQSSDENAFAANVTKNVEIGEYSIKVIEKAKPHKVASIPLIKKYKIPAGNYSIQAGKDKVNISFSGGTLEKFAESIKKSSNNKLKASVTWNTTNTQILVLEANKTGLENKIFFNDQKTKNLFRKMDFFTDVILYDKFFKIDKSNLINLSQTKKEPAFIKDGVLLVESNEKYRYNLTEKISYKQSLIMEIDFRLEEESIKQKEAAIPTGPNFSKNGDITLFDIHVEGESSIVNIPAYLKPQKQKKVEDDHYLEIVTDKRTINLDELDIDSNNKTLRFDMNKIIDSNETIEALIFKNDNTFKNLELSSLRFYDEDSKSGIKFKQELVKPRDALIVLDGIEIQRDTNTIDDLIKGLTLYIFDKTEKEESLKIDRDYEKIIGSLTEFLGEYNQFIKLINNKTRTDADAEGNTGEFAGDYSLISLTSKLRTIMMDAYPTTYGRELSLLLQIGIGTNVSQSNKMDKDKLKGIIEVDENILLEKMEKYPTGVKELFSKDSDGDMIIDTGIAYKITTYLKAYTMKSRGFFDNRIKNFDLQIEGKEKQIESYKDKLEGEEQKLREKFYKMEKAAKELEESSKKFDNLYKSK